jgi:hypothetical protein
MAISQGGGTFSALGPVGIPSEIRKSSVKLPGFFSFKRVSNSLPFFLFVIQMINSRNSQYL